MVWWGRAVGFWCEGGGMGVKGGVLVVRCSDEGVGWNLGGGFWGVRGEW